MAGKKSGWEDFEIITQRFEMIVPVKLLLAVDGWRSKQPSAPNRSEAIRRLVELGLKAAKEKRVQ